MSCFCVTHSSKNKIIWGHLKYFDVNVCLKYDSTPIQVVEWHGDSKEYINTGEWKYQSENAAVLAY